MKVEMKTVTAMQPRMPLELFLWRQSERGEGVDWL